MSKRVGTARRPTKRPIIVIAGEDSNDRKVLISVLEHVCPAMQGRLVEIGATVRLRDATGRELDRRVDVLYRKALARAERDRSTLACMFVHEDWDAEDSSAAEQSRKRVQDCLVRITGRSHYVLAVWEIEAWLLLLPRSVKAVFSSWTIPSRYRTSDTGLLRDPKKIFRSEVSAGSRRYREADAAAIVNAAVGGGEILDPSGTNRSWSTFHKAATDCCAAHVSSTSG